MPKIPPHLYEREDWDDFEEEVFEENLHDEQRRRLYHERHVRDHARRQERRNSRGDEE